jgi:hypothetical protein
LKLFKAILGKIWKVLGAADELQAVTNHPKKTTPER